jgi:hypothetical protein
LWKTKPEWSFVLFVRKGIIQRSMSDALRVRVSVSDASVEILRYAQDDMPCGWCKKPPLS